MSLRHVVLCAVFVSLVSAAAFGQNASPSAVVGAFYKFDRSHSQTFNRKNIDARKQWFSAGLYALLLNELKRERQYLKQNPTDKPYFGDGLPFQPLDETCKAGRREFRRSLRTKQEFQRGSRAAATATFAYPRSCTDGGDPIVYTIGLIKVKGTWVIDDVNYGEDTTLKQRLRRKEY
jgi:hypothetical protein